MADDTPQTRFNSFLTDTTSTNSREPFDPFEDFKESTRQKIGLALHKLYCIITEPAWRLFNWMFDLL